MASIDGLVRRFHKRLFDARCSSILQTKPAAIDITAGVAVLSQTYHRDIYMYLVAAKSFAQHVKVSVFIIVDDGLTEEDRDHIRFHLVNVRFVPRRDVQNEVCPSGGCWERLLSVVDNSQDFYVVQLDSDTVTLAAPTAVIQAIAEKRCFTLSTKMGRELVSVEAASAFAAATGGDHIQMLAESKLGDMPFLRGMSYIRGCAGFTGFARGAVTRSQVERYSSAFQAELGEKWSRWGSEQFMSNFLLANAEGSVALPFEEYPYWAPDTDANAAKLIHFIGDHRFTSAAYSTLARQVIKRMPVEPR